MKVRIVYSKVHTTNTGTPDRNANFGPWPFHKDTVVDISPIFDDSHTEFGGVDISPIFDDSYAEFGIFDHIVVVGVLWDQQTYQVVCFEVEFPYLVDNDTFAGFETHIRQNNGKFHSDQRFFEVNT